MVQMRYKRKSISQMSSKGRLRKEIGSMHLKILKLKRSERCEICQIPGNVGRFHILSTGVHPRLEFCDDNVLLTHWMECCQAHYLWHHAGPHDARNKRTLNKIAELRGATWEDDLRHREITTPKHDMLYLMALKETFKKELKSLGG